MTTITTFDDLLALGETGAPMPYFCRAWKRTVLLKDPTAEDLDVWRMYCNRNRANRTSIRHYPTCTACIVTAFSTAS